MKTLAPSDIEALRPLLVRLHNLCETPPQAKMAFALSWALYAPVDLYGDGQPRAPAGWTRSITADDLLLILERNWDMWRLTETKRLERVREQARRVAVPLDGRVYPRASDRLRQRRELGW